MRNKIIFLLILLLIPLVSAIDECERTIFDTDVPCLVLLPNQTTSCNSITISYYANTSFLYTQTMGKYTNFMCNSTFNQTKRGVYNLDYSTGDTGTITVTEDVNNRYYLYVIGILIFFILFGLGYKLERPEFVSVAGMLLCILAIDIITNGFPNLTNEFLREMIVVVLLGIGFYLIIVPWIDYLVEFGGSLGGRLD